MPITRTYRDLDLRFTRHPITRDVSQKTGDAAVVASVRNLVKTNFYDRPFHPEIGSGVLNRLFDLATPILAKTVQDAITDVINNFEPRVRLVSVNVSVIPQQNALTATIVFYIQNNTAPIQTTILLERVR